MAVKQVDVLVIGGGAVGVCAAHYLSLAGREVTLVEKGEICSGSSHGNGGLIVPSHSIPLAAPGVARKALKWMLNSTSPFYIKPRLDRELMSWLWRFWRCGNRRHVRRAIPLLRELNLASLELFQELAGLDGMDFSLERRGMILLFKEMAHLEEEMSNVELMRNAGVHAEQMTPVQIEEMNPGLDARAVGGIYFEQDGHLVPWRFVKQLAERASQHGVDVRPHTQVLSMESNKSRRIRTVRTTRGDFEASEIVLASGSWSPTVSAGLGLNLAIQPAKGYSITYKLPQEAPTLPMSLMEAKVGITPMGEFLRFAGTLELAGMDLTIDEVRVRAILSAVPQYLPHLNPAHLELVEIWSGLRPCTPDGLPFLGRCRDWENLTIAAGHAMIGLSLGPITGKLVAEMVTGAPVSVNLELTRVERFS